MRGYMGSCCYNPRKADFLWWHWLLLASVVGIPMLLAVFYVKYKKTDNETANSKLGASAALIFWSSSLTLFFVFTIFFYSVDVSAIPGMVMVPGFLAGFLYLSYVDKSLERGRGKKGHLLDLIKFMFFWYILYFAVEFFIDTALYYNSWGTRPKGGLQYNYNIIEYRIWLGSFLATAPIEPFMSFAAFMLPAHFWRKFDAKPSQKTAWKALAALIIGSALFWVVMQYSIAINLFIHKIVRGKIVSQSEIDYLKNAKTYEYPPKS